MRLIDADEAIKKLEFNSWDIDEWELPHEQVSAGLMANAMDRKTVEEMPTVDAVPSQLTVEEIKTIRIHINAFKEKLCNQHRYKEAEDYQQIVDKLDTMMDAERKEE